MVHSSASLLPQLLEALVASLSEDDLAEAMQSQDYRSPQVLLLSAIAQVASLALYLPGWTPSAAVLASQHLADTRHSSPFPAGAAAGLASPQSAGGMVAEPSADRNVRSLVVNSITSLLAPDALQPALPPNAPAALAAGHAPPPKDDLVRKLVWHVLAGPVAAAWAAALLTPTLYHMRVGVAAARFVRQLMDDARLRSASSLLW